MHPDSDMNSKANSTGTATPAVAESLRLNSIGGFIFVTLVGEVPSITNKITTRQ